MHLLRPSPPHRPVRPFAARENQGFDLRREKVPRNWWFYWDFIWVNYNNSLTWNKAIWGWFLLLTMIPVRSQWGRYNLPRFYTKNRGLSFGIELGCDPRMVIFHFKLGHVFTSPNEEFTPRTGDLRHIHNFCRTFTSEIGAFTPKNRDTSKMDLCSPSIGISTSYERCSSTWSVLSHGSNWVPAVGTRATKMEMKLRPKLEWSNANGEWSDKWQSKLKGTQNRDNSSVPVRIPSTWWDDHNGRTPNPGRLPCRMKRYQHGWWEPNKHENSS